VAHKDQNLNQTKAQSTTARKVYVRPKLISFGPVGALTQAGTGNAPEMAQGNNSMKML